MKIFHDLDILINRVKRPMVFTNGVFDILHRGHIEYLNEAKKFIQYAKKNTFWFLFYSFALLPVPLSRVVLRDHTGTQVLVGSVVGMITVVFFKLSSERIMSVLGSY